MNRDGLVVFLDDVDDEYYEQTTQQGADMEENTHYIAEGFVDEHVNDDEDYDDEEYEEEEGDTDEEYEEEEGDTDEDSGYEVSSIDSDEDRKEYYPVISDVVVKYEFKDFIQSDRGIAITSASILL